MSNRAGLKLAREKLRPYALAGTHEAAIIIDRATGEHLDFQVGGAHEVTPAWEKIPAGAQVTVLHVHHTDIGPGPEDWDVVALHRQIKGAEIVCPNVIFIIEKPDAWLFQSQMKPGVSALGSVWLRVMNQVLKDGVVDKNGATRVSAKWTTVEETNRRFLLTLFARDFILEMVSH